ncbi:uncharacterized protein DFL_005100 [Arthrobotrys flagrans]|uniref:Uncharacterized protein n=1 Tax=Arthrobotrys flagrans TaxID=97331 RepID=A0A437A6R9_ARTFL|nr:hypothetical protein DFL_005100 [Arthrobotrys flagrans]
MPRARAPSGASTSSSHSLSEHDPQELGTMYDYLAKIILLGPSGCGKSCLLHRFVRGEWKILSSQTIGVEFSSKIIKVGTGSRRKRIKLQLWDTAGQERFRSVTRSYYRGAAGALLIYDITRRHTFTSLPTFLSDARALASENLTVLLVGNKSDLSTPSNSPPGTPTQSGFTTGTSPLPTNITNRRNNNNTNGFDTPTSGASTRSSYVDSSSASFSSDITINGNDPGSNPWRDFHSTNSKRSTVHSNTGETDVAREVTYDEASRWAATVGIPVAMETSALNGENVDEVFERLARVILTRIELGEVDPDDPNSGVSYGDGGDWSISGPSTSLLGNSMRKKKGGVASGRLGGLRDWEEVFRMDPGRNNKKSCCG